MATINFVPSADSTAVSAHSRDVLREVLQAAGLSSCVITSTVRSPARQAKAMYINIESSSVQQQLRLYGPAGDQVIHVYQRLKSLGQSRQIIIDAMESKIIAIGPGNVSRHCADPAQLNVLDVAPSSISNKSAFLAALERAKLAGKVSKYLSPANGDPAFHIEIPQP